MEDIAPLIAAAVVIVFAALVIRSLLRRTTVQEYEQALRYENGRFKGVIGPGAYWTLSTTSIVSVDTRTSVQGVPGQELVTSDGVSVKVSLLLKHRVSDVVKAMHDVDDYAQAIYTQAQVAVREVVAGLTVEELLARRAEVGPAVLAKCREPARAIGIELESVDLKDLMLPAATKRLMNQVVDARQKGLAALEKARGETAALRSLANAGRLVESNPTLLQLRILQQLESSSGNTVLIGMPPSATPIPVRQLGSPEPTAAAESPPEPES